MKLYHNTPYWSKIENTGMIGPKKPLVFVMRARDMDQSINSISSLPYSKVWVQYHWEEEIEEVFPSVLNAAIKKGYTHISLISDDGVITPRVAKLIIDATDIYPVVSGWCNIDDGPMSNITKTKLPTPEPSKAAYNLYTINEIETHRKDVFETWFTGASFHTMSVYLWKGFPFMAYPPKRKGNHGFCSDYHICKRLQDSNVRMVVIKSAKLLHLKGGEHKGKQKELFCGLRPKSILWDEV